MVYVGGQQVLQGMGAFGQVVCDMGFCTCTVYIVTYIWFGLFFPKTSLFMLKLEKNHVIFFVSVCVAQYTAYGTQYPASSKTVSKKKKSFKKGKSVEKVLKKYEKSVE